MHSLWRHLVGGTTNKLLRSIPSGLTRRFYLTQVYQCNEAFENRHKEALIKKVDPITFHMEMTRRMRKKLMLFPIDVDVYVQSLASDGSNWNPDDLLDMLSYLRDSSQTYYTLHSTWDTVIRLLLHNNLTDYIFRVLTNPVKYGIFMDPHNACLLMDHYLIQKDFSRAARIGFQMTLVEDYSSELCNTFVLFSSLQWALNLENGPWPLYITKEEEPEEEVIVRQDYRPNPSFDDHFDLTEDKKCVGKSLAWFGKRYEAGDFNANCNMLGYIMWRKFKRGHGIVLELADSNARISERVVEVAKQHVTEHCRREELKPQLLADLDNLKTDPTFDIISSLEQTLKTKISNMEEEMVKNKEDLYSEMAQKRITTMEEVKVEIAKKKAIKEIMAKKKELISEEQQHLFFHNQKKIDLVMKERKLYKHPFPRQRPWRYSRIRQSKLDTEYMPPEMNKRSRTK